MHRLLMGRRLMRRRRGRRKGRRGHGQPGSWPDLRGLDLRIAAVHASKEAALDAEDFALARFFRDHEQALIQNRARLLQALVSAQPRRVPRPRRAAVRAAVRTAIRAAVRLARSVGRGGTGSRAFA
jgi:hypothetical protein